MLSSEMRAFKSLANGRRADGLPANLITSGVAQNVFAHVSSADRQTGRTDYAKIHWGLINSDNVALLNPETYIDKPTLSAYDYVVKWESTQRTALADLATEAAAATKVGSAVLAADIASGATTFQVTVKHADMLPGGVDDIFTDGLPGRICSHTTATADDGVEEDMEISGTPTYSGLTVTITVANAIQNSWTANGTVRFSTLIRPAGAIKPSYDSMTNNSAAGVLDDTTYPVELDNYGTIEEDWVGQITAAGTYSLTGDTKGLVGTGTIGSDLTITNSSGKTVLVIPAGMLSGAWAVGETFTFTTHPATLPIGEKRVVLPNALSLANNRVTSVIGGESES